MIDVVSNFYSDWAAAVNFILIIIAVLIINRIVHALLKGLKRRRDPTVHVGFEAFLGAIDSPLRAMVWVIGLTIEANFLAQAESLPLVTGFFPPIRDVAVILIMAWFLMRIVLRVSDNLYARAQSRHESIDHTAAGAINKLAFAVILVTTILIIMQILGLPITGLLAFGGAAGVAIGFAAQSLIANLFGGLTIYASRIFRIGDDIIIPGTDLAGTVENIGWRSTSMLGWDGKKLYIPNSLFNSSNMVNHSRLKFRAISEHVLLRYENIDKVQPIVDEGNRFLEERDDLNYFVFRFDSFGDRTLKLYIYAWVQTVPYGDFLPYADFMRIKEEILLSLVNIARGHGCEMILPVSNVYLHGGQHTNPSDEGAETP